MSETTAQERRAIGIIGGIGPQASARLHAEIVRKATAATLHDGADFPEIVHYSVRLPPFEELGDEDERAIKRVAHAAVSLANAGATTIGLACNTAHTLLPRVEADTGVKVERIPALVREVVAERGYARVGLLATSETIRHGLYAEVAEVTELVPASPALTERVEGFIAGVYEGTHTPEDTTAFRELVARFREDQRLDAVVLGCTELPVAYGDGDRTGLVDTIDVLADHLLASYHAAASRDALVG